MPRVSPGTRYSPAVAQANIDSDADGRVDDLSDYHANLGSNFDAQPAALDDIRSPVDQEDVARQYKTFS